MSKLTDEQIDSLFSEWLYIAPGRTYEEHRPVARAIESAATEPLLQRIAELEQRNRDLYEDVQRFKKHALNEKAARLELERQLEEARKDAERYQSIVSACESDGFGYWLPEICLKEGPVPPSKDECDSTIDAALQKGQS